MFRRAAALLLPLLLMTAAQAADPTVTLRTGEHDGYGRLVLDLPPQASAEAHGEPGAVVVQLHGVQVQPGDATLRNLSSIAVQPGQLRLALRPGVPWRSVPTPGKLVIDVLDAAAAPEAPPQRLWSGPPPRPRPQPPPATPVPPPPSQPPPPATPASTAPPPPAERPAPPPAAQAAAQAAGPGEPAAPVALGAAAEGDAACLPFAPGTGAAAFRRRDDVLVVFDERRPVDLAPLQGMVAFTGARIHLLPAATVLHMPLPAPASVQLRRSETCWRIVPQPDSPGVELAPIRPDIGTDRIVFAAAAAGRVVAVPDADTGGAVLVGTQTTPGQRMPVGRRTPGFTVLATMQGVAVEPHSDALVLRATAPGFVLQDGAAGVLALDPPDAAALASAGAAHLTRSWDFPGLVQGALQRRLQAATRSASAAPAQARTPARLAAAQAQLSLGLAAEAQALTTLIRADDASAVDSPEVAALDAVAALLAGRGGEAGALDDPRVRSTDEIALWRALRRASQHDGAPDAAVVFAATLPLVLSYPAALQQKLLPVAAETMVLGGEPAAAQRLLESRKNDTGLDFARALLDEAQGRDAAALTVLDRLAQSPDRQMHMCAAQRAAELRLRTGLFTTAQAADALDRLIFAWRGDQRELALRLRVAELRTVSGNWRAALSLLRETAETEMALAAPATRADIRARMAAVFAQALAQDAAGGLPPMELVALLEENPDLLPPGEPGRDLAARLAGRLAALDLPRRAMPVLEKLMASTAPGPARAEVGARLAELRLDQGDATAALEALSASTAETLPEGLEQRRTISFARATAARGNLPAALAALTTINSTGAAEARAGLLETAKDWPAAAAALQDLAARSLPASGPLSENHSRLVLRLAAAAAQAGDEALLASLREHMLPRLPSGKSAGTLRLLTQAPVSNATDLPRSAQEAALARIAAAGLGTQPDRKAPP